MSTTRELVEFVQRTDASSDDLAKFRSLLLDHVGVVVRGAQSGTAATFRRFASGTSAAVGQSPVRAWGSSQELSPFGAAMANAVAGHSTEFDDVHNAGSIHPGVVVFPAAFAACAWREPHEHAFVRAVTRGYEAMCRIARAARPAMQYARHFHPTATTGSFGAVVAMADILELDVDTTVQALGIAATMASGSMQFLEDGAETKRLHPALAARNGIEATLLAREGFRGPEDGIAGRRGFLYSVSGDPDLDSLTASLPASELSSTSIKAHACCRYKQGAIDCLLDLRRDHRLLADEVAEVHIGLPAAGAEIVGVPHDSKIRPRSVVDAQFSMPFGAAVAVVYGRAGLDEYADGVLGDARVGRLMRLVTSHADPEIDKHYPKEWRAWAEVVTRSGDRYRASTIFPKGDPENPLDFPETVEKFRSLTVAAMGEPWADRVCQIVESFPQDGALSELQNVLNEASAVREGPVLA